MIRAADSRLAAVERLLRTAGLTSGTAAADGHEGEIAVLRLSAAEWERMLSAEGRQLADEVKELGFRYVTVDLATEEAASGTE